jgi:hypothetical protein
MVDADGWMDGYEIYNLDTRLSWTGGPGKLALHSAEGSSINGLIRTFQNNPTVASHTGICWKTRRKAQFISLLNSAKSLRNRPGGVETNRDQVYQIEIVDFWTETPKIPDDGLQFIGECIADIYRATGGAFKLELGHLPLVGPEDGYTARVSSPFRYTPQEWDNFNAVAGHCNVPENEHTDPGKLNMDRIFYYARQALGGVPTQTGPEDEIMKYLKNKDGRVEIFKLSKDGRLVNSWQSPVDGSLSAWGPIRNEAPGPFVEFDAFVADDGRLVVVANVDAFGGVPFITMQSAPSSGPWTEWVQLNSFLQYIHSLSGK